jgi:hypothetical protein
MSSSWRILQPTVRKGDGYYVQSLRRGGVSYQRHLHQWIALTFYGEPEDGLQVRHLDGDKANNRVANLRYGTAQENALDKVEHGTLIHGEIHPRSKLTERDVAVIHDALGRGVPQNLIAVVFNIYPTVVSKIKRGELWGWSHPNRQPTAAA